MTTDSSASFEFLEQSWQPPDWHAIHSAHRLAEAQGLVRDTQRPLGAVSLDDAYSGVGARRDLLDPVSVPDVPARSNGFGGRSKTWRHEAVALKEAPDSTKNDVRERLQFVDTLSKTVTAEIDDENRRFYDFIESTDWDGEPYLARVPIEDQDRIKSIRSIEHAKLSQVIAAMKVEVRETAPRMRGFPGANRIQASEPGVFVNTYTLRRQAEEGHDVLLLSLIDDLTARDDSGPLIYVWKTSYGVSTSKSDPDWVDYAERAAGYDPFDLFRLKKS